MAVATPRLPGIRFETVRPAAPPALPRMDIAAFAGFARSGPVGEPVAVEDVVRFEEVFGGDLPLAWDPSRDTVAVAHLAQTVREFFRNGGRRCWVLRLARDPERTRFRLPGLLRAAGGRVTGAGWAVASSPGSWADALRVDATLQRQGLDAALVRLETETPVGPAVRIPEDAGPALLRLELQGGIIGFFPPRPVDVPTDATGEEREMAALRPAMEAAMVEAAVETFTLPEILALEAFYETPEGAAVMAKMQPFMHIVKANGVFDAGKLSAKAGFVGLVCAEIAAEVIGLQPIGAFLQQAADVVHFLARDLFRWKGAFTVAGNQLAVHTRLTAAQLIA